MIAAPRGKATHIAPKLQLMPTCPTGGCGQHPVAGGQDTVIAPAQVASACPDGKCGPQFPKPAATPGRNTHIAPKLQLMPTCPAAGCGQHPAA